jgi:hypothetical protein|eukprot:7387721-Prymnesium_polylepis.1
MVIASVFAAAWVMAIPVFAAAADEQRYGLAVFTLLRGGSLDSDYVSFVNSRDCLQRSMSRIVQYDDVAFHEGNVPSTVQSTLRQQM